MQSYLTAVIFCSFALAILLCVFFGCDNAPRVRLVKDDDETFHFQWAEPLKEERIILVRVNGWLVYNAERRSQQKYYLVHFAVGSILSAPIPRRWNCSGHWGDIDSVEILPAHRRNTIDFPARLYKVPETITGNRSNLPIIRNGFEVHGDQVILREHPFFQEYRIDEPSRLDFAVD